MSEELELEKTYLLTKLPPGLKKCKYTEIIDIYIPAFKAHPQIRIRKKGEKAELTKKVPVNNDASRQTEHTIPLSEDEFEAISAIPGKKVRKLRYYYPVGDKIAEIDIFQDGLSGLVLADFEFSDFDSKDNFKAPDFCLVEITQEEFIGGGRLAGKSYADIEADLNKFNYKKLSF